jgi:hypothetical protein
MEEDGKKEKENFKTAENSNSEHRFGRSSNELRLHKLSQIIFKSTHYQ